MSLSKNSSRIHLFRFLNVHFIHYFYLHIIVIRNNLSITTDMNLVKFHKQHKTPFLLICLDIFLEPSLNVLYFISLKGHKFWFPKVQMISPVSCFKPLTMAGRVYPTRLTAGQVGQHQVWSYQWSVQHLTLGHLSRSVLINDTQVLIHRCVCVCVFKIVLTCKFFGPKVQYMLLDRCCLF